MIPWSKISFLNTCLNDYKLLEVFTTFQINRLLPFQIRNRNLIQLIICNINSIRQPARNPVSLVLLRSLKQIPHLPPIREILRLIAHQFLQVSSLFIVELTNLL